MVDGYSDDQKCGVVDGSDDQGVMLFMGKGHIWFSACKLKNGCIIYILLGHRSDSAPEISPMRAHNYWSNYIVSASLVGLITPVFCCFCEPLTKATKTRCNGGL